MPSEDPQSMYHHLRVHLDISGVLNYYKDVSGIVIVKHHAHQGEDGQGRDHLHIWLQHDKPVTSQTVKNHLKNGSGIKFGSNTDWRCKAHNSFERWWEYVHSHAEPVELLYNVQQIRPAIIPIVAVATDGTTVATVTSSVPKTVKSKSVCARFIERCVKEIQLEPGVEITMNEISDAWTTHSNNKTDPRLVKPILQSAHYVLNPHLREDHKKANRDYFASPHNWNGVTFY